MENIYEDIAARTGGNIYIGVVGPVRTGKSTLIKRIMETFVIPNINDPYRKERAKDELPQSGSGKTIMTSEPKFVPEEAVEITPDGITSIYVRMIDSVGYMVTGAVGAEENGVPRMVTTPWYDHEIPLTEAAELGTKKVMEDHCSIGLVVTSDGSITDIPRADYVEAESRAITDMLATGKPFLVVINSKVPQSNEAKEIKTYLYEKYHIDPMILDCQAITENEIAELCKKILYQFPMTKLQVFLPRWMDALDPSDPIRFQICQALLTASENIYTLADAESSFTHLAEFEYIKEAYLKNIDLSSGTVNLNITLPDTLFFDTLSDKTGITITSDAELLSILMNLSSIKNKYEAISDALDSVKATGYGIVMPGADEMTLQSPEPIKKGGAYGVKMKASAPSIHMIRVNIETEVSPMVGDEAQSQALISYLTDQAPDKLWESNIFGRSVFDLVQDGLNAKLIRIPGDVREKFRGCLTKIVNDGANSLICIIL